MQENTACGPTGSSWGPCWLSAPNDIPPYTSGFSYHLSVTSLLFLSFPLNFSSLPASHSGLEAAKYRRSMCEVLPGNGSFVVKILAESKKMRKFKLEMFINLLEAQPLLNSKLKTNEMLCFVKWDIIHSTKLYGAYILCFDGKSHWENVKNEKLPRSLKCCYYREFVHRALAAEPNPKHGELQWRNSGYFIANGATQEKGELMLKSRNSLVACRLQIM